MSFLIPLKTLCSYFSTYSVFPSFNPNTSFAFKEVTTVSQILASNSIRESQMHGFSSLKIVPYYFSFQPAKIINLPLFPTFFFDNLRQHFEET